MTGGKPVDSGKAKALVDAAEKIIAWIERLGSGSAATCENLKRPDHLGGEWQHPKRPTHWVGLRVESGQFDALRAGESVALEF